VKPNAANVCCTSGVSLMFNIVFLVAMCLL
jgi:hypothetical protein